MLATLTPTEIAIRAPLVCLTGAASRSMDYRGKFLQASEQLPEEKEGQHIQQMTITMELPFLAGRFAASS